MAELPEITLPDQVVIPPVQQQSYSKGFLSSLSIAAFLDDKPWTMSATLKAYDPATGIAAPVDQDQSFTIQNLKLAMAVYPMVAQVGGGILQTVSLLLLPWKIETQIVAGLTDIDAKEQAVVNATNDSTAINLATAHKATADHQLADWQSALTQHQALSDSDTNKAAAIANDQAQITTAQAAVTAAAAAITQAIADKAAAVASATSDLTAAQTLVWVTLLAQWRTAAASLGVTDPAALPMALYGLTKPEGI